MKKYLPEYLPGDISLTSSKHNKGPMPGRNLFMESVSWGHVGGCQRMSSGGWVGGGGGGWSE